MLDRYTRMQTEFKKDNIQPDICPHLALKGDIESYAAFPSTINACHKGTYAITPKISHQNAFCLSHDFAKCPNFHSDLGKKFRKDIQYRSTKFPNRIVKISLLSLLGISILLLGFYLFFRQGNITEPFWIIPTSYEASALSSGDDTPQDLLTSTHQIKEHTAIIAQLPGLVSTVQPSIPAPTEFDPVLALDTPIGGEQQFIIHRIAEGESLQYLADRHNTTIDAIISVNEDLITPLWVDWVVVIPVNTDGIAELPKLKAFQIQEEGITVEKLAAQFDAPIEKMSLYNNIDSEHILHKGEWLLIPHK